MGEELHSDRKQEVVTDVFRELTSEAVHGEEPPE